MISKQRPYIMGVGSFVPPGRVNNDEYMAELRARRPDGRLISGDWLERHFGIETRAYDGVFPGARKPSREEGGLFDGDLAVRASQAAIVDAGISVKDIDTLVHVSCTPDTTYCCDHLRFITVGSELRSDVHLVPGNLGCAGLAWGLRSVQANLFMNGRDQPTTVLLVASNCPSGYLHPETLKHYREHPDPWAWLSPAVFGDGAGAIVFRLNGEEECGLVHTWYETHPEIPLVRYPAGGCVKPSISDNLGEHLFLMDATAVNEWFVRLMMRNRQKMEEHWDDRIAPIVGHSFDISRFARVYMHQANGVAVKQAAQSMGIPEDKVPINIDRYGNTSAASTVLLLDEDRRAGRVKEGDEVAFLWIGAGNGAMNGYAVCKL